LADQGRALAGKGSLGNAQALIYSLSASDFHDIKAGSNGYAAGPGYDLVTGRGTPIANFLVQHLIGLGTLTVLPVMAHSAVVNSSLQTHAYLSGELLANMPATIASEKLQTEEVTSRNFVSMGGANEASVTLQDSFALYAEELDSKWLPASDHACDGTTWFISKTSAIGISLDFLVDQGLAADVLRVGNNDNLQPSLLHRTKP